MTGFPSLTIKEMWLNAVPFRTDPIFRPFNEEGHSRVGRNLIVVKLFSAKIEGE